MKVSELIAFLQQQPLDLPVAYRLCSEQHLLDVNEIEVVELCEPRPDGWVQNFRKDKPFRKYLLLPGN